MTNRASPRQILRYKFDNFMAKGTAAQIIGLAVITIGLMFVFALILWAFNLRPKIDGAGQTLWESFWGVLRPKTPGWSKDNRGYMIVQIFMLLCGLFVASMLISILTSGFRNLVQHLREGRSMVPINDHTLILGWSPSLMSILPELILANESERNAHVVILSERSKVNMDDELRNRVPKRKTTTIVTRSGDPYDSSDLAMVNIDGASSVMVLTPEGSSNPDIEVIKTLMAIVSNPNRGSDSYHIVASIRDPKNLDVAKLAGKGEAELIPSVEIISKITAQTCRQPGLPIVYTELMSFDNNEMYLVDAGDLVGRSFGDTLFAYSRSCPIGVWTKNDRLLMNPPGEHTMTQGDRLILIAQDDSTIIHDDVSHQIDDTAITSGRVKILEAEITIIIGWNAGAEVIVRELDQYIEKGSELYQVVANEDDEKRALAVGETLKNQKFVCVVGEPTDRALLDTLPISKAHHVILLKDDNLDAEASDANVLVTLLHTRDIIENSGQDISVVSELSLERNRKIAHANRADDFVVGDYLIGLLYAQISQRKELNRVFGDLLSESGAEIYLKPAEVYVKLDHPMNFFTVVESAKRKGEVAFGYRHWAEVGDAEKHYGVKLNPTKTETITFRQGDRIVVVAEDYITEG